jgi:hypothetical protein
MFHFTLSYLRYAVSALSSVAFGFGVNYLDDRQRTFHFDCRTHTKEGTLLCSASQWATPATH